MKKEEPIEQHAAYLDFLEHLYQDAKREEQKQILDPSWAEFFERLEEEKIVISPAENAGDLSLERIEPLIDAYRRYGHLMAQINPIAGKAVEEPSQITLAKSKFALEDENRLFPTHGILEQPKASLKEIKQALEALYCGSIGFECKELFSPIVENWLQKAIESQQTRNAFTKDEKLAIADALMRAELLESFLHTKHVGKKRFSLQGAETVIAMLAFLVHAAAEKGMQEIYIGMSHRGRLNVLANILHKSIASILRDFDEEYLPRKEEGMGDIRYHKGHANEAVTTCFGKTLKLSVTSNPSHLESVNPVVEGQVHARQFLSGDEKERKLVMPLLIHGDASLSGQGVVYETLQMSRLKGFETGGTLHLVINNQVGFTTPPSQERSTLYCTDIAKAFGLPVFHVNAEDPQSCIKIALLALEVRQRFACDVFIDLNCYRKYGHNEGDEPLFTQPLEYRLIEQKTSIYHLYRDKLISEGTWTEKEAREEEERFKRHLNDSFEKSQKGPVEPIEEPPKESLPIFPAKTGISWDVLREVADSFHHFPEDFHLNRKIKQLFEERRDAVLHTKVVDWAIAELLAYGTLVLQGTAVRLAGQDSGRGTFSHRHALWVDQVDSHPYYPLAHIRLDQARFEVLNTCLSEVAALGFEYGYSTVCQEGLTIWEAQYGDFANAAQVMIDQYIVSGEQKWGQSSGLVLFLPHGFEGQGPEHSSSRFERFLALAAQDNIQIVYPSLPAQFFHLLRRQAKQPCQKPLIVLTPKGLLRYGSCSSSIQELIEGSFLPVIDDPRNLQNIEKLVFCSGRIYFEIEAARKKQETNKIACVRIEQLYPLPQEALRAIAQRYFSAKQWLWVQEEPENMGAWSYLSPFLSSICPPGTTLSYVGREKSAAPATGFYAKHKTELSNILEEVLKL